MSTTAPSSIETTVVSSLITFGAKADEVRRNATWADIDIDSLDLAELAQIVEDEYGVRMEGDVMKQIRTVGDAIDFITEKTSAAA
jgi:acyl carrier protein